MEKKPQEDQDGPLMLKTPMWMSDTFKVHNIEMEDKVKIIKQIVRDRAQQIRVIRAQLATHVKALQKLSKIKWCYDKQ